MPKGVNAAGLLVRVADVGGGERVTDGDRRLAGCAHGEMAGRCLPVGCGVLRGMGLSSRVLGTPVSARITAPDRADTSSMLATPLGQAELIEHCGHPLLRISEPDPRQPPVA